MERELRTKSSHKRSPHSSVSEFGFDPVQLRPLDSINPAPENDEVYKAIAWNDPDLVELARSIKAHGIQDPILSSRDGYIISGHRRWKAARLAKLEHVPIRVHPVSRAENRQEFLKLLVEMNSQRSKSISEVLHETMIKVDPKVAHEKIVNERIAKVKDWQEIELSQIDPEDNGRRAEISKAKIPFLQAVRAVIDEHRDYWPLSDRQIHYRLLGADAPLTHASKPGSQYRNDKDSYRKLTDLVARARVAHLIPWQAIDDATRPTTLNSAFQNTGQFFRQEFNNFLSGYWRNRLQSQPDHVEIVAEKLTVQTILQDVARDFTMPLTIARGMSSLPPKKAIVNRYRISRKRKLVLLVVSDLDPAGDAIAEDLVKCFRRDFRIRSINAFKVALTIDQVQEFGLAPSMEAKDTSPTYERFVDRYGITDAYELEAMAPEDLTETLTEAIKEVLDIDLYNQELAAEEADSASIIAVRQQTDAFFKSLNLSSTNSCE